MAIGRDFARAGELELKVRAQARRIAELESGGACAREAERHRKAERELAAKADRLEKELAKADRGWRRMVRTWFDVFERAEAELRAERDKAVARAEGAAKAQEERALRAERRCDALADAAKALKARVRELEAALADLEGRNAKLAAQANRDFENSSAPSSMQVVRKKRAPDTREATGRRPGAQPGHAHRPRRRPEPTRTVEVPDPEGWEADPDLYRTSETVSKSVVSARVAVEVVERRAAVWRRRSTGARLHAPFPEGVSDEVSYDASCRALAFPPATGCGASLARASRFLSEASGGALSMSAGMVWGLAAEFSAKSGPERAEALESLMSSPVMHADLACANVGGGQAQVLILANGGAAAMYARERKGHEGVAGTPLQAYAGCAVHDHDLTFHPCGTPRRERVRRNIRYLVGSARNEPHLTWNAKMLGHVRSMVHRGNSLPPGKAPDPAEVEAMSARYDEILDLAAKEYEASPPGKYYRDGYNLSVRLREYRDSELRFLSDPAVPPDNSRCERLARVFKRKQRACIAFRSFEGLSLACEGLAAVANMRSAGKDVFAGASAVFARPTPEPEPDGAPQAEA